MCASGIAPATMTDAQPSASNAQDDARLLVLLHLAHVLAEAVLRLVRDLAAESHNP